MKNKEKYQNTFKTLYDASVNDQPILHMIQNHQKSRSKVGVARKWIIAMASVVLICSGVTMVGLAAGWGFFANIFRTGFGDQISAELIETGALQELDLIQETDDYVLKFAAFTGDMETQFALFELTPKAEFLEHDEVVLYARTFYPYNWEDESYKHYGWSGTNGYKIEGAEYGNTYYFSYKIPGYFITNPSDIMIQINSVELYSETTLRKNMKGDLLYTFTPDRTILAEATRIEVNEFISKETFPIVGFPLVDPETYTDVESIISPLTKRTLQITDVVISKYKTEVKGLVMDEEISYDDARSTWNQFSEPIIITEHYYDGIEKANHYNMVAVNNQERIRLFVNDVELPVDPVSLQYSPGKGHDADGNMNTEGYYGCSISFAGFDYEQALKVEIHFGDQVITLK